MTLPAAPRRDPVEGMLAFCRERGVILTVQRRIILEALAGREDHPTADQIFESVRGRLPGLSRMTVYRVLDAFVKAGAIQKVSHAGAVARFDPVRHRHHHLICDGCGELFDLDAEALEDLPLPVLDGGFLVKDYRINFSGTCSGCRTSQGGEPTDG